MVQIKKECKAKALVALYNTAHTQGVGFLQATATPLTETQAAIVLAQDPYVDYLHGRVIKVSFETTELRLDLFDRDVGQGAGLAALTEAGCLA